MYCQKCNRLLRDDSTLCTKCGFDNKMYESHKLTESKINNKKVNPFIVFIGILILVIIPLFDISEFMPFLVDSLKKDITNVPQNRYVV